MTKKDYESIAKAIARVRKEDVCYDCLAEVAYQLSRVFEADNERFDKEMFFKACKV